MSVNCILTLMSDTNTATPNPLALAYVQTFGAAAALTRATKNMDEARAAHRAIRASLLTVEAVSGTNLALREIETGVYGLLLAAINHLTEIAAAVAALLPDGE